MSLLHYLSYGGAVAAFIFVTLSLASGLLWISELIEEHSRVAKTIGQRGVYVIIIFHVLLYFFDSLPLHLVLFSIACHIVYLQNFTPSWPIVSLTSLSFLASCAMVVMDHFLWFFHFARVTQDARQRARTTYRPRQPADGPGFADIATFFGICVWLAPLFLFLSLSANDNALPMNLNGVGSVPSTPTVLSRPVVIGQRASLFKTLFDALPLDYLPRLRPRPKRRDTSQGIIAPPSPRPPIPSPLASPVLGRVPSMTNLPPPRRMSNDTYTSQYVESPDLSADSPSPFALGIPPKKASGATRVSMMRRASNDGRLEMRRVVSTSSTVDSRLS